MRFYYYMSGQDATISIKTRTLVGGHMTEKWSMSGDQGLTWNRASLPLTSGDPFQVIFKAVKGSDSDGFLGLDYLSFTPEYTQSSSPVPRRTTTPPPTTPTTRVSITDQMQTTVPTTSQERPTPAGQTGNETIYISVGVVSGILILLVFLVLAYLLVSKRRGGKQLPDEVNIPASMENLGYGTDLNITAFAMQDIDTNMYGANRSYTPSTLAKEGFSNPTYSNPMELPINNDTTA